MRILSALIAASVLFGITAPAFAGWEDEITTFDHDRLARFWDAKKDGINEAGGQGGAFVSSIVAPDGGQVSQGQLVGNWQCRIVKLGGYTPVRMYDWFRCTVRGNQNGLYFEKVTGSERLSGYLDAYQGKFILLAAMTVGSEPPKPYSGGNAGIGAAVTHTDQVGVVSSLSPTHLKIEFPYPVYESTFDVIEMRR